MSQYAQMYFAEKEEDIPIAKTLMRLPSGFRDRIIKWKKAMKYGDILMWGVAGKAVQLPMTYTMYKNMSPQRREKIFKKLEIQLINDGITYILLPRILKTSPFTNIQDCKGDYIKPFLTTVVIRYIANEKIISKELKDIEVVILDGNKGDVDMILDIIYPHINYLSIITNYPERFEKKAEYIFQEVGLNVTISSYNKPAISQGDIVIDTHYDDPGIIHFCKKNSVYIDMGNHIEKTVMLLEKQKDVMIVDEFFLAKDEEVLRIDQAELVLSIKGVFGEDYNETIRKIKKENIVIKQLTNRLNSNVQVDKL